MTRFFGFTLGLLLLTAVACGKTPTGSELQERWNSANAPGLMGQGYVLNFAQLPLKAELATAPWSDTYWASYLGGTSYRWYNESSPGFNNKSPTRDEALAMGSAQLARLSPSEKYDIYLGRFDYPLTKAELARTSPDKPAWEGICHGWAPAALMYQEPKAVEVVSKDGILLPFGSADVKALLSLYQGNYAKGGRVQYLGKRCNIDFKINPEAAKTPECRDTNAGSFHIVLTNQIALRKAGFVADVTRDAEVWNQPVSGYETVVLKEQPASWGAAIGTVKEVVVETRMYYGLEVYPRWHPLVGTSGNSIVSKTYQYRVELNRSNEIIGGEWISDERPDFLWATTRSDFTGSFAPLGYIYNSSISARESFGEPGVAVSTPVPAPAATPAPVEPPAATPAPVEPPVATPAPVEPPAATPAPVEPPAATPAPVEPPAATPAPVATPMVSLDLPLFGPVTPGIPVIG